MKKNGFSGIETTSPSGRKTTSNEVSRCGWWRLIAWGQDLPTAEQRMTQHPANDAGSWYGSTRYGLTGYGLTRYGSSRNGSSVVQTHFHWHNQTRIKSRSRFRMRPYSISAFIKIALILALIMPISVRATGQDRSTDGASTPLPPHPRLLFNAEGIKQLKERIAREAWARNRWKHLLEQAEKSLTRPVELPPRGGNWYHWYSCPTHGAALRTGRRIGPWQWEHQCTVGGEILASDPNNPERDYDGVVIGSEHHGWSQTVKNLGIVYQVTGDRRFAEKGWEILRAYAEHYPGYPLHTIRGEARIGGGKVGCQTLDEATWLIPLVHGADLIWPTLSEEQRGLLATGIFLPAVREVILPHRMGVHNIQCWKNSAVGLVGFLLGDEELIAAAIDDPKQGYWEQSSKGVSPDGVWWEGAWGYHFYTLSALWPLCEAAHNCGRNLYGPELKRLFQGPLVFATPHWRLPAFNDSGEVALRHLRKPGQWAVAVPLYELAFARFKDPLFAELLTGDDRENDFALFFGVPQLPEVSPRQWGPANYENSGYAILAAGEGLSSTWLCFKYGPHGGGHGHPDKLNFVLYHRGRMLASDPGTARYGVPIQNGWYRTTLAHNTLTVDERSQQPATGRSCAFGSTGELLFAMGDAGKIYPGIQFFRTMLLAGQSYLIVVDQVIGEKEHLHDIAYHAQGTWQKRPGGQAWQPPDKPGYRYLRDCQIASATAGPVASVELEILGKPTLSTIGVVGEGSVQVITGTGVGHHAEDRIPVIIFRRKGNRMALVWWIGLDAENPSVRQLEVRDAEGQALHPAVALALELPGAERTYTVLVNPQLRPISVSLPGGELWESVEPVAVRTRTP